MKRAIAAGVAAAAVLLAAYFGALTALSGWEFTVNQFGQYWFYIVPLAAGFGVQICLYLVLRQRISHAKQSGAMVAASGTTSGAAMVSCCAHYLVNLAPVLGAAGIVTFISQFQVQLFWVGLVFNAAGIAYVAIQLTKATKEHARCVA